MLFGTIDDSAECEALSQFILGYLKEHGPRDIGKITLACSDASFRSSRVGMVLTTLISDRKIIKIESTYRLLIARPESVHLARNPKTKIVQRLKNSSTGTGVPASVLRAKYRAVGLKGHELKAAVEADLARNRPLKNSSTGTGVPASILRAKHRAMGLKGRELTAAVEADLKR
jgi:hypothetical protein